MESFEKPAVNGDRYENPKSFTNWTGLPGFQGLIRWRLREKDESMLPSKEVLDEQLPVHTPKFDFNSKLSATWLGHATVFVHMDGISFITDPLWSSRASPFSCVGPRRYRKPPCTIDELPPVNFGVISHNHYDHLDEPSIKRLSERFPDLEWFVPAGLGDWVKARVNNNIVHELTWGDHVTLSLNDSKYQVYCVPAQHWSMRGLFDKNKSLWCGWAIIGPDRKFYYSGDTGFCEQEFRKIGTNLGPFDLAALPIGCYAPRWVMQSQHINPEETVKIHKLVRAHKTLGIHWGTYTMGSYEHYLEPRSRLREEVEKAGLNATDVFTLNHGETWTQNPAEPMYIPTPSQSEASLSAE